jgi:hypothetical protein
MSRQNRVAERAHPLGASISARGSHMQPRIGRKSADFEPHRLPTDAPLATSGFRSSDLAAEVSHLADLIPWSATFTGHLEGAEAIYDGPEAIRSGS